MGSGLGIYKYKGEDPEWVGLTSKLGESELDETVSER